MDHFAWSTVEPSLAQREGRRLGNFMGYAVTAGADMVSFGASAIRDMRGSLMQAENKLVHYYRMRKEDKLSIARGCQRTAGDEIRRHVIHTPMRSPVVDRKASEEWSDLVLGDYLTMCFDTHLAPNLSASAPVFSRAG